ncbi:MAG: threonine/homoserine/homoserine lactone efflux protein [Moritella dasanensis]|jgi:threonine/homoserine/homoserine lactone efflux protein
MTSLYLNFLLFAVVISITPGPTNFIALTLGHRYGINSAFAFIISAASAASLILLLTAQGIANIFIAYPLLQQAMTLIGCTWLIWLSWQLYWTPAVATADNDESFTKPSWIQGAGLQFINPKTWFMAITVSSLFNTTDANNLHHNIILAAIFFVVACNTLVCWALLGQLTRKILNGTTQSYIINKILACLLLLSVLSAMFTL